jgi:RNA polymerase sigma factor (sigma-70 family)
MPGFCNFLIDQQSNDKPHIMEVLQLKDNSRLLDDLDVVRRVLSGEKELFEILLRRYNQTLYRVIRSYLKDEKEIQDVMQNTYLKAFDKLFQFKGNAAFSTWLIKIGINEALLRLKEMRKTRILTSNFSADSNKIQQVPDNQLNAEKTIIRQEAQRLLESAIDNLPEKYRVIYILKEIEGLSNEQLCESLGITDSNIKVRLHRAKSLLKESLFGISVNAEVFAFGNTRCDALVTAVMHAI